MKKGYKRECLHFPPPIVEKIVTDFLSFFALMRPILNAVALTPQIKSVQLPYRQIIKAGIYNLGTRPIKPFTSLI